MNGILHIDGYALWIPKTLSAKSERSKFGQNSFFTIFGRPNLAKKQVFHQYMLLTPLLVFQGCLTSKVFCQEVLFWNCKCQNLEVFTLKLWLKSKYLETRNSVKYPHLSLMEVSVAHFDGKPVFCQNLAFQKQKKLIFDQIWISLIWPKVFLESPRGTGQYVVYHSSGEFTQLKISFQLNVCSKNKCTGFHTLTRFKILISARSICQARQLK